MTDTEQVLALLKWRYPPPMFAWELAGETIIATCVHDDGRQVPVQVPNLYHDLNEYHDMESKLNDEQKKVYAAYLHPIDEVHHHLLADFLVAHSNAARRRRALLYVLGLWKE